MLYRRRYYCTKVASCTVAHSLRAYSHSEFRKLQGKCRGTLENSCGAPLSEGTKKFISLPMLVGAVGSIALLAYFVPIIYTRINPPALTGYEFELNTSTVTEAEPTVTVTVIRSDIESRAVVDYVFEDQSATAGVDFQATSSQLIFSPGQKSGKIVIPIVADNDYQEVRETFLIRLPNIDGSPTHLVTITDPPLPEDQITKTAALVGQLSVMAADLAGYAHSDRALRKFVRSLSGDSKRAVNFIEDIRVNENNIQRTRESYLVNLNDLLKLDRQTVISAFENKLASLDRTQGDSQQYRATEVLVNQFVQFSETKITEMDIWLEQLRHTVESTAGEGDFNATPSTRT